MKTSIAGRIRAYGAIMLELFLSAIGCFVLRRCFRFVAAGIDAPETKAVDGLVVQGRDPLVYVGGALILLALSANEQAGVSRAPSEAHF
jgi:hypothetical protein